MSLPPEAERKIGQLDNDVEAIYELLASISETQARHGEQLEDLRRTGSRLGATQMRQGNRLDELAAGQAEHSQRLDKLATVQERHGHRLELLAAVQEQHGHRLEKLTTGQEQLDGKIDQILVLLRGGQEP